MKQEAMISAHNKIAYGSFSAEDKETFGKHRGAYQKIFSDNVKNNYNHQCAITGIRTRSLLVGAHIIPWSVDKEARRMEAAQWDALSDSLDDLADSYRAPTTCFSSGSMNSYGSYGLYSGSTNCY